jgi:hypothetical protein
MEPYGLTMPHDAMCWWGAADLPMMDNFPGRYHIPSVKSRSKQLKIGRVDVNKSFASCTLIAAHTIQSQSVKTTSKSKNDCGFEAGG